MPSYVYRCPRGHEVEVVRKIAERDEPLLCTACAEDQTVQPMTRVPAAGTGPAGFPGAGSWRDRYR